MESNRIDTNQMHFNRFTLAFNGRHAPLELRFYDHYFFSALRHIRIATAAAAIFYALYGISDLVIIPNRAHWFWIIRWLIVCPCALALLGFTFSKYFYRYMQLTTCSSVLIAGLGIIAMSLMAQLEQKYTYVGGMVQITFFLFTFSKLRFIWATCCSWLLLVIYAVSALFIGGIPHEIMTSNLFHLTGINLMGMMASYGIEFYTRRNFYLSRQLETKRRRLSVANESLEERVARRTTELRRTNTLLREEISERKDIEAALRASETRFRHIVDNLSDYVCVHDLDGRLIEVNRQMISGLGYKHSELTSMKIKDLMIPAQQPEFDSYLNSVRYEGLAMGKITLLTRMGEKRRFEYSNTLAEHPSGQNVVYSLIRDVTELERTEKALAESQARFKMIFETAAAGMITADAGSGRVIEANPAAASMYGATADRIIGVSLEQLTHPMQQKDHTQPLMESTQPVECYLITSNGDQLPILKSTRTAVFNNEAHWIVSFINIKQIKEAETAKREVEDRLNRAQHLQSIGTLAGGIAHDFNNVLFGIMGFAELAQDDAAEDSLQAANLNEILHGCRRAKEMIGQILTFSRQDDARKEPLQPIYIIKEALKLLRASLPTTIEIDMQISPDIGLINANATQLHQVLINLGTNAAHAMANQTGRLKIDVDNKVIIEDEITPHGHLSKGRYVRLCIGDNGCGIPAHIADRIFEPFFTTKPQSEGTGMGLSVVMGIIQAHSGVINVSSRLQHGTEFEIMLPEVSHTKRANHDASTDLSDEASHPISAGGR